MSFLKITDPSKRAAIVNEYLKLKKSIKQSSLSEKLGDSDLQRDLIKLYKPITESQAGIAKELGDTSTALKALPATISSSLQAIMPAFSEYPSSEFSEHPIPEFTQHPSIEALQDPAESFITQVFGKLAIEYLPKSSLASKTTGDATFEIRLEDGGKLYIGTSPISIHGDDVTVGEKTYRGTPGLWELITLKQPGNYSEDDRENYANILWETNAMSQPSNPNKPKSSPGSKYKEIIKPIWDRAKGKGTTGKGVAVILPGDPNELVKMLKLRMEAYNAGNTGVVNEIVAICDELIHHQGVIDKESYKVYMTRLNR